MVPARQAAVVVPFYRDHSGQLRVVLIQRTARVRYAGQLAFPGGHCEPADPSMQDTAVREACEELGLQAGNLQVLDELPAVHAATTGDQVWPYVAQLHGVSPEQRWQPQQHEVAAVLDVPATELTGPHAAGQENLSLPGWSGPRPVPVRYLRGRLVWGLTLRILAPALDRALAGAWPL